METMTSLRELGRTLYVIDQLRRISTQIHRLDETACNYQLVTRQERRLENLLTKAEALAQELGYHIYHQGDPRGCALYLVENNADTSNYTDGVAL